MGERVYPGVPQPLTPRNNSKRTITTRRSQNTRPTILRYTGDRNPDGARGSAAACPGLVAVTDALRSRCLLSFSASDSFAATLGHAASANSGRTGFDESGSGGRSAGGAYGAEVGVPRRAAPRQGRGFSADLRTSRRSGRTQAVEPDPLVCSAKYEPYLQKPPRIPQPATASSAVWKRRTTLMRALLR